IYAQQDDRCSELLHDYLVPRNVGAMLDSAIRLDGAMRGVICCESIGKRRSWLEEEIFFMRALADQVSLALGNRVRQEAVELIKRNDSFFRDLFEDSPLGITIRDANGRLLVSNSAWQRLWCWQKSGRDADWPPTCMTGLVI